MSNTLWNEDEWGSAEDYNVDLNLEERRNFKLGQGVTIVQDVPQGPYENEEGTIVGFAVNPWGTEDVVIHIEGMDPQSVPYGYFV